MPLLIDSRVVKISHCFKSMSTAFASFRSRAHSAPMLSMLMLCQGEVFQSSKQDSTMKMQSQIFLANRSSRGHIRRDLGSGTITSKSSACAQSSRYSSSNFAISTCVASMETYGAALSLLLKIIFFSFYRIIIKSIDFL